MEHPLAEQLRNLLYQYPVELALLNAAFSVKGEDALLLDLDASGRPLTSTEFIEHTRLTTGRVANILKQLEAKGLILRTQGEDDRRTTYSALTDKGAAYVKEYCAQKNSHHAKLLNYLGDQDAREFIRVLERILQFTREYPDAGNPEERFRRPAP